MYFISICFLFIHLISIQITMNIALRIKIISVNIKSRANTLIQKVM